MPSRGNSRSGARRPEVPTGLGDSMSPCMGHRTLCPQRETEGREEEKVIWGQMGDSAGVGALFCKR